ncbi:unnamed protein product [Phytophthora fragariaefolia]|uniref:Unnamed protein product n=1 Tax=Phytophthora fragariaefolia TaxID=1490495 RepID=A0A9W6YDX1_9STRA|nr:unnamed protein product [Phytophthora fragariaefolia]
MVSTRSSILLVAVTSALALQGNVDAAVCDADNYSKVAAAAQTLHANCESWAAYLTSGGVWTCESTCRDAVVNFVDTLPDCTFGGPNGQNYRHIVEGMVATCNGVVSSASHSTTAAPSSTTTTPAATTATPSSTTTTPNATTAAPGSTTAASSSNSSESATVTNPPTSQADTPVANADCRDSADTTTSASASADTAGSPASDISTTSSASSPIASTVVVLLVAVAGSLLH